VYLIIYTVITTSWLALWGALIPSAKWHLAGAIKIRTAGRRLTITTCRDQFEIDAACIHQVWLAQGLRWDARHWGGSQLLFWRGFALLMSVDLNGRERQLAFPLFHLSMPTREETVRQLTDWAEHWRTQYHSA